MSLAARPRRRTRGRPARPRVGLYARTGGGSRRIREQAPHASDVALAREGQIPGRAGWARDGGTTMRFLPRSLARRGPVAVGVEGQRDVGRGGERCWVSVSAGVEVTA